MTKEVLCMNPGPIEFDPRVLEEMSAEGISHVDPAFIEVFGKSLEQLRKVFLAPDGQPLVVAGSGTLGWDMVGANLVEPNDDVLVVNTGYFGDSFGECLEVFGANVSHLRAGVGARPSDSDLAAKLKEKKFKLVTITHVDTSTGVLTDIKAYTEIIRRQCPNAVVVVDGVCSLGGEECRMSEWDVDVVLTGSQKCLGVPPGLCISMLRPRALKKFESRKAKKATYFADLSKWLKIMKNYEDRKPSYFATPATNLIYALNKSLTLLLEDGGMESRFKEHRTISLAIKKAITNLGCTQVPVDPSCAANTMTCVRFPAGVTGPDLLPKMVSLGISLSGGLHAKIKSEYFRIGHMGPSTRHLKHVLKTIQALEKALSMCGHKFTPGVAVKEILAIKDIPSGNACPFSIGCSGGIKKCPAPVKCQVYTLGLLAAVFAAGLVLGKKNVH